MKKFLCLLAVICLAVFFSACDTPDDTPAPTRVSVTLDLDGGEIAGGISYTAIIGEDLEVGIPTKYGFDFVGWKYNDDIVSITPFNIDEEYAVTLKAEWAVKPCTITVDLNGGSFESGIPLTYQVHVGNDAQIPSPTKAGYNFDGWYYNSGKIDLAPFNTPDVFNMTIKAKWSVKTYTVNVDYNGGTTIVDNQEVTSYVGEQVFDSVINFPKPKKEGYVFAGYKVNGILIEGSVWNIDEENTTAIAHWEPISIGYVFDLDGGEFSREGGLISFGSSTQSMREARPTKVGHNFEGWAVNGESLTELWQYLPTSSSKVKVVALWSPKTYTVTLNAGEGGLEGNLEVDVTYGQESTLPIPTPIVGKNFAGWKIGELDKIISSPSGLVVYNYDYAGELTAVYTDKQYVVFINLDGSIERVEISIDEEFLEENIPIPKSKPGYAVGWELSNQEITSINQTTEVRAVVERAFSYVAEFRCTSRFSLIYTYDQQITLPSEDYFDDNKYKVRKDGYKFLGWTLTEGDTENYFNQIKWEFTSTTIFYPVYEPRTYNITYDYSNIKVQSTLYDGDNITNNKQEIVYGSEYSLYNLKVSEDLVFVSWALNGNIIENNGIWKVIGDVTLTATVKEGDYKPVAIDVNINLNGGTGKPFGTIVLGEKLITLVDAPTPPTDYKLIGYKYRDKTYLLNDVWDVLDYDGEALIACYQELPKVITVNIDLNGGTGSLKAKIQVGSKLTTISPKPVAANGYMLIGFTYKGEFYSINDVWDVEDYDGSYLIAQYEKDDIYWGPIV